MLRFSLLLCALFLPLVSSPVEAQADRRGDTIFVADKFLGDSAVAYQLVAKYHADSSRAAEFRLRRRLGQVQGKEWTFGDIIVSADFNSNGYNASWIVAGPRDVVEPYVARLRKRLADRNLVADWLVQKLIVRCACD
ncbi:MAG TPA: hypothetical protein VJ650_07180 [Gemmatimonadaceae bacterium]|nr:hypothetical protein [Gemmatimonadaceae bacterium]